MFRFVFVAVCGYVWWRFVGEGGGFSSVRADISVWWGFPVFVHALLMSLMKSLSVYPLDRTMSLSL